MKNLDFDLIQAYNKFIGRLKMEIPGTWLTIFN